MFQKKVIAITPLPMPTVVCIRKRAEGGPPPPPSKRRRAVSSFLPLWQGIEGNTFNLPPLFRNVPLQPCGQGTFCTAKKGYTALGVIVVKILLPSHIRERSVDSQKKLFRTSLKNYHRLERAGFPVVRMWLTDAQMIENLVFVADFVEKKVDLSNPEHKKQGLTLFKRMIEFWNQGNMIVDDFRADNLGIDTNGKLVIFDFREKDGIFYKNNFVYNASELCDCLTTWGFSSDQLAELIRYYDEICNDKSREFIATLKQQIVDDVRLPAPSPLKQANR